MRDRALMLQERRDAVARVLHDLHQMVVYLQDAHHWNHTHALNLDLPSERALIELIGATVQTYQQQEKPK